MKANLYETRQYLDEYLLFHFGKPKDIFNFTGLPQDFLRFHEQLLRRAVIRPRARKRTRALDVGCAVGRFTFELAACFDEVIGMDYSKSFIGAARTMARRNQATITIKQSGATTQKVRVRAPFARKGVRFQVGDAMQLGRLFEDRFDLIAGINLLCRLPDPRVFLHSLKNLIRPGGQLLLASPFSWLPEYTPRRKWLSAEQVIEVLSSDFDLRAHFDLPFIIREHQRKFQLVVSDVMSFCRR